MAVEVEAAEAVVDLVVAVVQVAEEAVLEVGKREPPESQCGWHFQGFFLGGSFG